MAFLGARNTATQIACDIDDEVPHAYNTLKQYAVKRWAEPVCQRRWELARHNAYMTTTTTA
eukprot:4635268-Heterocapsa_arctica.AAC.1